MQRRRSARDRVGLCRDGALDATDQQPSGLVEERDEECLLTREVEIDAALRGVGAPGDLVDQGVAVAVAREDVERGIEDALSPLLAPILLAHHRPPPRTRPTRQSVL